MAVWARWAADCLSCHKRGLTPLFLGAQRRKLGNRQFSFSRPQGAGSLITRIRLATGATEATEAEEMLKRGFWLFGRGGRQIAYLAKKAKKGSDPFILLDREGVLPVGLK